MVGDYSSRSGIHNPESRGVLLCVTDLATDSDELLDLACELAKSQGAHLEMMHVIDIENGCYPSQPDGHMGIQFRLGVLARNLSRLKQTVTSILMFGTPEDAIAKRAKEMQAKLIAFAVSTPEDGVDKSGLVERVARKVTCRVVVLSTRAA